MGDPAYEIKSIERLFHVLNHGDDGAEATRLYRDIMERLAQMVVDHGGKHKGQLIMTVDFVADERGVDVSLATKAKLPSRPVLKERFFMSERQELTLQDPGRGTLFPGGDLGRARGHRGDVA